MSSRIFGVENQARWQLDRPERYVSGLVQIGDQRRSSLLCLRCSHGLMSLTAFMSILLSKSNAHYSIQQAGVMQSLPDTSLTGRSHRLEEEQTINTGATSRDAQTFIRGRKTNAQSLDPRPRYCRPSHRKTSNIEGDRQAGRDATLLTTSLTVAITRRIALSESFAKSI